MNILQYENYQKKEIPADPDFPYQTYPCSIPLDFTEVPLHWHDEMEIVYIKKGCGLLSVDFNYYQVKEKDIILILPGQLHSIKQDGTAMMEYENIIFRLDMLYARQSDICTEQYFLPLTRHQIHVPVHLTPESSGYEQVAAHLDAIDLIRSSFPPAFELFIKGRLFELFYVLISASAKPDAVSYTHQNQINKTREILKYIEQHYGEKVSIAAIAKTVGFSESHFMKFFKSALGTRPIKAVIAGMIGPVAV